jgi:hypothetical protein
MKRQQCAQNDFTPDIHCAEIVEILAKKMFLFLTGTQPLLSTLDSRQRTRYKPVKAYRKYQHQDGIYEPNTASLCWYRCPVIRTSSIDWAQMSRFYLKTEIESSLRNVVFWKINRTVFYIKTGRRIMSRNIILVLMGHRHKIEIWIKEVYEVRVGHRARLDIVMALGEIPVLLEVDFELCSSSLT